MGPDRGAHREPYDRAQAIVGWALAYRPYIEGRARREFGVGFDDLYPDDATAWYGVMTSWLADGMAAGAFTALVTFHDRVKWGTETRPDAELWGMDESTQAAIRMMEQGRAAPAAMGNTDGDHPDP